MSRRTNGVALLSAAAVILAIGVYLLRLDRVAGLVVDDAWYVLLARSLAAGDRFGMVNSIAENAVTPYPPGFPLVLSMVFRFFPQFPENVWMLKTVSVAAMGGIGLLTYQYFVHQKGLTRSTALTSVIAIVLTPALVFLATSTVMSECVFTFVQLLAVVLLGGRPDDRFVQHKTLVSGAAAAAAMLVRSAGVAVVAAGIAYLVYRRQWRRAVVFAAAALVCLLPWLWFSSVHAPTAAERAARGGGHALSYTQNFWLRWASAANSGTVTASDLPARVASNLFEIGGRDVGGIVAPMLFRPPSESGLEVLSLGAAGARGSMGNVTGVVVVSLVLSAFVVLGFVVAVRRGVTAAEFLVVFSLIIIVLWPFWPFRFVLPLTPFLVLYLLIGVQRLVTSPAVLRIMLLSVIGLHLLDHLQYLAARRAGTTEWHRSNDEVEAVLQWMNGHLHQPGHVATTNEPLVHLWTGRKTVPIDNELDNRERWRQWGVRYLVYLDRVGLPDPSGPRKMLYRSPEYGLAVVEN